MRRSIVCVLVSGLSGAGCLGEIDGAVDAGALRDAGQARDGGSRDAGASRDAGTPDAGADAGTPDAGADAGVEPDAGPTRSGWSPGCLTGAGLAEGEHTFTLEALDRRYILRLPNGYAVGAERAWPLVLALHGNGGSAATWDRTSGTSDIRSVLADDAVLVIAEAIDGQWRDYSMPSDTWPARIESELLYFDFVIEEVKEALCLDERAIFAMGFSGGGSFSGVLGCRREDIRGIAVGGSVIYFDPDDCIHTPAAWITIGEGEMEPARVAYRDFFRDRAGCATTNTSTTPAPCVAYDACDAATPVHYCQHPGGHVWPDFASAAMGAFFESLRPE